MSKICPKCKTENRDLAKFCLSCNAPLTADTPVRYCPSGKHPMDPGSETCRTSIFSACSLMGAFRHS